MYFRFQRLRQSASALGVIAMLGGVVLYGIWTARSSQPKTDPVPLREALVAALSADHEGLLAALPHIDINWADDTGMTVLHAAAFKGDAESVRLLINRGASVNAKDGIQCTPLHLAATAGNIDAVRELLESGAATNVVDQSQRTPLYMAASLGHADAVELLLKYGADPKITGEGGSLPAQAARAEGHPEVARLIEQHTRPSAAGASQPAFLPPIATIAK
jgi:ankyrin repeat protein